MATVFLTCDQQKRFEPSKVSVDICGQHQLEQCISHYMFARYICLSLKAFEGGHLSSIEIFELHCVFLHRYYCHSFSPKASRSQSCDLLLAFGRSHCNRKSCKGTAWWLLLSSHSAKVSAIFCKCNIFSTATSSPRLLVKKQRISPQPNVLPQWLQVDKVTTRAQARFTPGMIAAAHIIPAVPNFCGQRKLSPGQGFGVQQGWLNCRHLRIWKPFQVQGQKSKQNIRNCSSFESKWQFFCGICWLFWTFKAPAEALISFSSSAFC